MDQIFTSSSSSSSSYPHKLIKSTQPSYLNSLHSVRKPLPKPMSKKFIAPLPPTPAKVYKVDSSDFKDVVRKLTSTPEFQYPSARRLRDIAPPPLDLPATPKPPLFSAVAPPAISPLLGFSLSPDFCSFLNDTLDTSRFCSKSPVMDCFGGLSPLGLSLSPAPLGFEDLSSQETAAHDHAKAAAKFLPACDPAGGAVMSPLGSFSLSPSSLSWCSSALLSPGTLSTVNLSPVL